MTIPLPRRVIGATPVSAVRQCPLSDVLNRSHPTASTCCYCCCTAGRAHLQEECGDAYNLGEGEWRATAQQTLADHVVMFGVLAAITGCDLESWTTVGVAVAVGAVVAGCGPRFHDGRVALCSDHNY